VVEPALRLAGSGVALPPAHAACLQMLAPVMTMNDGARIYAPQSRLLGPGDVLHQPGLVAALELVAGEGAGTAYEGTIAARLLATMERLGGLLTRADLEGYAPRWREPAEVRRGDVTLYGRGDALLDPLAALAALPVLHAATPGERALALLRVLAPPEQAQASHTTNVSVVDADGNACILTTSLGLGSGDWLPGLDLHLNSMLGEVDLLVGEPAPGERMRSMMSPLVALDDAGAVALAIGSAGGTRLRSALVQVASAILDASADPAAAVEAPRLHPARGIVHAEPGLDEEALAVVEREGYAVRRWPAQHHFFGGVSAVGRAGAAGDPRRDGAARTPR
jgi:gamma-glutamyltranspeptidase/glutathione hydrolase